MIRIVLFTFLSIFSLYAAPSSRLDSLYLSLDPLSITQNLAFYELYPETKEGHLALERAWHLLCQGGPISSSPLILPKLDLQAIVSLITKQPEEPAISLSTEQHAILQKIAASLHNRKLLGFNVWTEKELLSLAPEQVDLGRALLIYQFEEELDPKAKILDYEASLDLMALQIRARLPKEASHLDKISHINRFIFQEMGFRYPPHSLDVKHIDLYTFLPSVIDSRQGVCLGVSVLYLCLAQRLDLPLEIITPPGHIYLRYPLESGHLNIETTARGINLPSEAYLGVGTKSLPLRNIKETIGLVFCNQASLYLRQGQYEITTKLYQRACLYVPDEPLFRLFLGMSYLFQGKKKEGKDLLLPLRSLQLSHSVAKETIPSDYLDGKVDIESLKLLFVSVDENYSSLIEKEKALKKSLRKYPKFRAGILQLATTQLQLGKTEEAFELLTSYHNIDPTDPTIEYYLSILSSERLNYPKAWEFLQNAKSLTQSQNHFPKALFALERDLRLYYPPPASTNNEKKM
jgi:tetratricopeptide (TPR) repeat protein